MNIKDKLTSLPLEELFKQVGLQVKYHGIDQNSAKYEFIYDREWCAKITYGDRISFAYGKSLKDALVSVIIQMAIDTNE